MKRRGVVLITEEDIAAMLHVGEGQRVIGVRDDWARMGIQVMIEGPGLPECAEGTCAVTVSPSLFYDPALRLKIQALIDRWDHKAGRRPMDVTDRLIEILAGDFDPRWETAPELKEVDS